MNLATAHTGWINPYHRLGYVNSHAHNWSSDMTGNGLFLKADQSPGGLDQIIRVENSTIFGKADCGFRCFILTKESRVKEAKFTCCGAGDPFRCYDNFSLHQSDRKMFILISCNSSFDTKKYRLKRLRLANNFLEVGRKVFSHVLNGTTKTGQGYSTKSISPFLQGLPFTNLSANLHSIKSVDPGAPVVCYPSEGKEPASGRNNLAPDAIPAWTV
jgi:hypothetical protein